MLAHNEVLFPYKILRLGTSPLPLVGRLSVFIFGVPFVAPKISIKGRILPYVQGVPRKLGYDSFGGFRQVPSVTLFGA